MIELFVFLLGLLFGSFFNVVIYRVPNNMNIAKGRSMCPKCGHTLSGWELIPLVSIIVLRFKCKSCKQSISPRYFWIELITGLGWAGVYHLMADNWMKAVSGIILFSMCLIVAMIDFDTHTISDAVLVTFSGLQLIWVLATNQMQFLWALAAAVVGCSLYAVIYIVAKWIYKREAFGMGDVLYMAAIGCFFSIRDSFIVAIGSFFIAAILLVVPSLFRRHTNRQTELPFGPAMSIMAMIMFLWGEALVNLYISLVF